MGGSMSIGTLEKPSSQEEEDRDVEENDHLVDEKLDNITELRLELAAIQRKQSNLPVDGRLDDETMARAERLRKEIISLETGKRELDVAEKAELHDLQIGQSRNLDWGGEEGKRLIELQKRHDLFKNKN